MTMPLPPREVLRAADQKAYAVRKQGYQREALYPWCSEDGQVAFWRLRYKHPITGEKWIRPMYWDGSKFIAGEGYSKEPGKSPKGKLLYGLPELLAADPAQTVWILEGEKCADALAALGMIATTSGAADSAKAADWTPLRGRHCIISPDNDEPGRNYADAVGAELRALGCTVETIDVGALGLPDKGDCVDWLAQHPGATAADMLALPMLEVGDSWDDGDVAPHKGSDRPQGQGQDGDDGDIPLPHFEVLHQKTDGRAPGVYWVGVVTDKDGAVTAQADPAWICSPLTIAAQTRDPQSSEWGRLLVFPDNDGKEHRWAMPMRMLAGSGEELRAELLSEGLVMASHPSTRRMVTDYIARERPTVTARCVARTGWHSDVFVLPRETFGDSEAEPVIFQTAAPDGVTLGQAGTLQDWRDHVAAPCAGNSRLVVALSCAFAGPCIGLLNAEGGGLHLRGGSSIGKTTVAYVAASVYGPPSFVRTWRQTDNGLEGIASLHSDMLLVLDEMGQLDPKHAGAVAYMLANGQGKGRSRRDGSPRAVATWRVMFLSTGEIGLSDLMTQAGGKVRAGQEVRVIDLPADAGARKGLFEQVSDEMTPGMFADALRAASAKHYGHALPAFLHCLVSDPTKAREYLRSRREALSLRLAPVGADGQVRRVADRFALIAAAGELATDCGLTGWRAGEAEDAARKCFDAWLAARGTSGAGEPQAMLAQVRAFLEVHGESRFTPWDDKDDDDEDDDKKSFPSRTINRAGFRRESPDGPTYYVEREVFKSQVCVGFDPAAVARTLEEAGAMRKAGDGRFDHKTRLPDGRNTRVYIIEPAFWDVGEDAKPPVPRPPAAIPVGDAGNLVVQRVPQVPVVPAQNSVGGRRKAPRPPKGGRRHG